MVFTISYKDFMNIETDTMLETVNQIIKSNFGCFAEEIRKFEILPIISYIPLIYQTSVIF